jgi:hypothetical protein
VQRDNTWERVEEVVAITKPMMKLMKLFDSDKPIIGKVYDRVFGVLQGLPTLSTSGQCLTL